MEQGDTGMDEMTDEELVSRIKELTAERERLQAEAQAAWERLRPFRVELMMRAIQRDTATPSSKKRARAFKLAQMTVANGCTPAEAEVAARMRGV
jgi:hypothetical protein